MWGDAPTKAPPKKCRTARGTSSVEGGLKTQFPCTYSQAPTFPTGGGVRTEEEVPADLVPAALAVAVMDNAEGVGGEESSDDESLLCESTSILSAEKQLAEGTRKPPITRRRNAIKVGAFTMLRCEIGRLQME